MAFLATEIIRTENVYSIQLTPCPVLLKVSHTYLTSATTTEQDSSQQAEKRLYYYNDILFNSTGRSLRKS